MSDEKETNYFDKFLDDICEDERLAKNRQKKPAIDSWARLMNQRYGEDYLNNIRYKK